MLFRSRQVEQDGLLGARSRQLAQDLDRVVESLQEQQRHGQVVLRLPHPPPEPDFLVVVGSAESRDETHLDVSRVGVDERAPGVLGQSVVACCDETESYRVGVVEEGGGEGEGRERAGGEVQPGARGEQCASRCRWGQNVRCGGKGLLLGHSEIGKSVV